MIEAYTYNNATARLMDVSVGGTTTREFTYVSSGQVVTDARAVNDNGPVYDYGLNARGRIGTVLKDSAEVATYTYDSDEQRVVKTANGATTHYHYDSEGRLVSETDGITGAMIREYIWLGLTPVAVIAAEEDEPCDNGDEIAALNAQIAAAQDEITARQTEIANLTASIGTFTARIARLEGNVERLEALVADRNIRITQARERLSQTNNPWVRWRLRIRIRSWRIQIRNFERQQRRTEARIIRLQERIAPTTAEIATLTAQVTTLEGQIEDYQDQITALENACTTGSGSGTPPPTTGLTFLHADHLGRPQFATNPAGEIVWDGGIVTPFGEGVTLASANAQSLMFPGQYADEETGLSHNWHRTYDPALGRYLQSDPIGLAGGLNRYAYGLSNPVSNTDPTGEIVPILIGIGIGALSDVAFQLIDNGGRLDCLDVNSILLSGALGGLGGGLIGKSVVKKAGKEWSHWIPDRYIRPRSLSGKNPNPYYKPWLDNKLGRAFINSRRFNGNYVTPKFHAYTDPFRNLKGMKKSQTWMPLIRMPLRTPGWIPGMGLGGLAGANAGSQPDKRCGCK